MMRDTINSTNIKRFIAEINEVIPYAIEKIKLNNDINKIKSFKRMLLSDLLEKTIAHYSVGDDKATVSAALLDTIPAFEEAFEYDTGGDYEDALWMVSLGILCDIPLEEFKRITAILKRDRVNDALLSAIIRYKQPDWLSSSAQVLWQNPYGKLVRVNTPLGLKQYLDNHWYQENEDSYWHGLHKNTKVNNYFGYWSWESAALAKARGIDDSSLKGQKYYPYDATHW